MTELYVNLCLCVRIRICVCVGRKRGRCGGENRGQLKGPAETPEKQNQACQSQTRQFSGARRLGVMCVYVHLCMCVCVSDRCDAKTTNTCDVGKSSQKKTPAPTLAAVVDFSVMLIGFKLKPMSKAKMSYEVRQNFLSRFSMDDVLPMGGKRAFFRVSLWFRSYLCHCMESIHVLFYVVVVIVYGAVR